MVNSFRQYGNYGYCVTHGRSCTVFKDFLMVPYHMEVSMYNTETDGLLIDHEKCYGPFTTMQPPPPLAEEEWQQIFVMEDSLNETAAY